LDEDIKIECIDLGIIYDELISSGTINISYICENSNSEIEVPLYYKNKFAGVLKLFCFINRFKRSGFQDKMQYTSDETLKKKQEKTSSKLSSKTLNLLEK
jgi:hypothetical protein